MNRLIVDYRDVVGVWFAAFRDRCLGSINLPPTARSGKVALYAKRGRNRGLDGGAEESLIVLLQSFGYRVDVIDFGHLTMEEQIATARGASLMFGVHGNNLTNSIWLDKHAALIEIFPAGFHSYDFQVLCETAGAKYLGVEGVDYGFVHREGTRWPGWTLLSEPYNGRDHHQDSVGYVPLDVVAQFLSGLS